MEIELPVPEPEYSAAETTLAECCRLRMMLALIAAHHMNPPKSATKRDAQLAVVTAMMNRYVEDSKPA